MFVLINSDSNSNIASFSFLADLHSSEMSSIILPLHVENRGQKTYQCVY